MTEDSDGHWTLLGHHFRPFEPDFIGEVADEPRSVKEPGDKTALTVRKH
jgi:hypothetical protein